MANAPQSSSIPKDVPAVPQDSAADSPPTDASIAKAVSGRLEVEHPIAKAIVELLHRARDIEESVRVFIPLARQRRGEALDAIKLELDAMLTSLNEKRASYIPETISAIYSVIRRLERIRNSTVDEVLTSSLFQGLFSAYDRFLGGLLTALYQRRPELLARLDRTIHISHILAASSLTDVKDHLLSSEIDMFRRDSYVEQFVTLESQFGMKLRSFTRWPDFVEISQRRNLMTHCDGIVNEQYIRVCTKEGYALPDSIRLGEKLSVDSQYLVHACDVVMEVGLKLGQTLWRKVVPDEIEEANKYLQRVTFDCLCDEQWHRAETYCEFAVGLEKTATDLDLKIAVINRAIAQKFGDSPEQAAAGLTKIDWSAAANDFRLAEAILGDRFSQAATIMRQMGPSGILIEQSSYYHWPLFRIFRSSQEFLAAYEEIYKQPFSVEMQKSAEAMASSVAEELSRPPDDQL